MPPASSSNSGISGASAEAPTRRRATSGSRALLARARLKDRTTPQRGGLPVLLQSGELRAKPHGLVRKPLGHVELDGAAARRLPAANERQACLLLPRGLRLV